jgi:hypothetical protein
LPQKVDGEVWAYAFLENITDALSSGLGQIVAVTGGTVPASPLTADATAVLIERSAVETDRAEFENVHLKTNVCDVRDMRLVCSAALENANPEYVGP